MISRRFFAAGFVALAASAAASPSEAKSLLYLFGEPQPVIIRRKRELPQPISVAKPKRKKQLASKSKKKTKANPGKPYAVDPLYAPQEVAYYGPQQPGEIVVNSREKFLYHVQPGGRARRYGVAIGQEGLGWTGTAIIGAKAEWPSWKPTPAMIKRQPEKYGRYKDGMAGGPENPLGARALYFYQNKRDTAIRIHGTTQPWTIGKAASNGCFRMVNEHVIELYDRVAIGTRVTVI